MAVPGGNAFVGSDGKYHLYVCRGREDSPRGHAEWGNSIVVHAVADIPTGPYKVKDTVGPGHNPEVFQLKDGRYVIYVINGYYIADSVDDPWQREKFQFNPRDRHIIEGLSNLSLQPGYRQASLSPCCRELRSRFKLHASSAFRISS